jgi:hypothetical protein
MPEGVQALLEEFQASHSTLTISTRLPNKQDLAECPSYLLWQSEHVASLFSSVRDDAKVYGKHAEQNSKRTLKDLSTYQKEEAL